MTLIEYGRGAEAEIFIIKNKKIVIKKRIFKKYMPKKLIRKIIKSRTKKEVKIMKKLENVINVPSVYYYNYENGIIVMEYIEGKKLSNLPKEDYFYEVGKMLAKMHNLNIYHGDITTSNILIGNKIYIIDFGLSNFSNRIEDFAVDIHLMKESIKAKHEIRFFNYFIEGYKEESSNFYEIYNKFLEIEKRGRYKER